MATLDSLAIGASAVIERVTGDRRHVLRLMELGLLPGTKVELLRKAPLGDPLQIRLRGYSLSIRKVDAAGVELEPATVTSPAQSDDEQASRATA